LIKTNRDKAAQVMYVAAYIVKVLAVTLYPFIPTSAQKIWNMLGYEGVTRDWGEAYILPKAGQQIKKPKPVFKKISDEDLKNALQKLEEIRQRN